MALRVTQAHASVLFDEPAGFDGEGVLRVTQAHVCILANLPPEAVSDTIALSESVETFVSYIRAVVDTIALDESVARVIVCADSIALTEAIELHPGRTLQEGIALTETVVTSMSYRRDVEDELFLDDTFSRVVNASDTIAVVEAFVQVATVEDTIGLSETIFNDRHIDVADTLSLTDESDRSLDSDDGIILVETISASHSSLRDSADGIAIYETISAVLNADCPDCCDITERYFPYVGVSDNPAFPAPPSTTTPTLTQSHSVVLSHPFTSPTLSVTLRAPSFGNRDRLTNQRIQRESRGGTLLMFADLQWPQTHTLVMEFEALSEETAQSYLDFVAATLGKEIRLVDHESRTWRGFIVQPNDPVTRNRRNGVTASLVFEGELV